MAEELKKDEQTAAGEIDASAAEEKTQLEQIGDDVTGVKDLLQKSIDEGREQNDPPKDPEPDFDIHSVTPEVFAKSMEGDKEKAIDFIHRLTESCGLMPQDMVDEEGGQYFTDEMLKSIEGATTEDQMFKAGILYAMQEMNERTAKKDTLMFQTQIGMAKSIEALTVVVGEMSKSITPETKVTPAVIEQNEDLPITGEKNAATPLSSQTSIQGDADEIDSGVLRKAIKDAFPGNYGDSTELAKQNEYADWASRYTSAVVLDMMPKNDRSLVESCLPV